jgi:hypothetical protein
LTARWACGLCPKTSKFKHDLDQAHHALAAPMDTLAKRAKNLWRRRTQLPGLKSSSGWDSASSAGSSQGSIATVASSQFSDGSIDGTLLAIEDLVSDHIEHLSKTLKRRSRLHFEYIERLGQLRESVRSKRVYLTSRDGECATCSA